MFPHGGLPDWELSLVWPRGVLSHGRLRPGWPEGSAPWCRASCLPGLGWSLWRRSLWPQTGMSVGVVAPRKVASSTPWVSLPSHVSLVTASVCVGVSMCVCVSACVCMSVCISVYVFVYLCLCACLWGCEGWVLLVFFSWFYLLFLFFCCF